MKLLKTTFAAVAALALLPNCGDALEETCTLMGCATAFQVSFAGDAKTAGAYEITVTADGQKTTCTVTLPLPMPRSNCANAVSCDQSKPDFYVATSGCALGDTEHQISGIVFPTASPAQIDVQVYRGATEVGSGSYQPTYTTSYPNGERCGPTCKQADAESLTLQ